MEVVDVIGLVGGTLVILAIQSYYILIRRLFLHSFHLHRARVKAGMRILGATASSDDWNVHIEKENPKHTVARVTAYRKDQDPDSNAPITVKSGDNK